MIKKIKALAPVVILSFAMLFAVGQAFGAEFTAENKDTGFDSENDAEAYAEIEFEVENENEQCLENAGEAFAYTGDNSADYNTGSGQVESGLVDLVGGFVNDLNVNSVLFSEDMGTEFTATNDTTGAESENDAEAYLEMEAEVENDNSATVSNYAYGEGDTGDNSADYNTGNGDVDTGDAVVGLMEENLVNDNFSEIALIMDDPVFEATNDTTGYDSENDAEAYAENEVEIENENWAEVENEAYGYAYTGNNSADYNTGDGGVETGVATATVDILNDVNLSNDTVTIDLGDSSFEAENKTTGAESENDAEAYAENEVEIENDSEAIVTNHGEAEADTGDNSADYNTGSGTIMTGEATADVLIENDGSINENISAVTINLGEVSATASNEETGYDSENDAEAYVENEVEIENDNWAEVENEAYGYAYTGDNSADYNTGDGIVETGNATAATSIVNEVNVNTTTIDINPGTTLTASNDTTGAESENDAEAYIETEIEVENKNSASVNNYTYTESDTGGNSTNYNTGSGSVTSGGASVTFGIINNVNSNSTTVGAGE